MGKGLGLAKASHYFRFYLARALEATGRGDEYLPHRAADAAPAGLRKQEELRAASASARRRARPA